MSMPLVLVLACFVLAHLALRSQAALAVRSSQSAAPEQGRRRRAISKVVAAVRIAASAALLMLLLVPLLERAAALPAPARWAAWLAASAAMLLCLINAAAGLWILSPFVGVDLGMNVVAAGGRGIITRYGVTRLEISSHAGWSAHLPYWLVALRPLRTSPRTGPRWVELKLRQDQWTDSEVRLLRQAAIFSPYRDITSTVSVTRRSQLVTIRLGLAARGPESRVQRQLEQALAEHRAHPKRRAPE
jgi:hypothetical protein